ncbi:hypothetical protein [Vreelandella azerica]|uniref:hypothetical protein n=1 Tax=Vreelandella azerica TaxID=2732867 RepID=UPI001F43807E|nr:hypothetical protein [Halomonas azerica]
MTTDTPEHPQTLGADNPRRRWPRWLALATFTALGLVALWLGGTYWLLNSQWLPERLSQLEGIDIQWEQGRSRHPGRWEVEGLIITREDEALNLQIQAERASLTLSLLALLRGELQIIALDADGIRRLRIGDQAIQGDGRFSLRDTTLNRDTLAIPQARLQLENGQIIRNKDNAVLARDIVIDANTQLDAITLTTTQGELNPEVIAALSANIQLSAHADAWDVFMPYLAPLPWLAVDGRGELNATLDIVNGYLQADSQLTLAAPALGVRIDEAALRRQDDTRWIRPDAQPPSHQARGDGIITLKVPDTNTLTLEAALKGVSINEAPRDTDSSDFPLSAPYVDSATLTFATAVDNTRLDQVSVPEQAQLAFNGQVTRLDMLERPLNNALEELLDDDGLTLSGNGLISASGLFSVDQLQSAQLEVTANALQATALDVTTGGQGRLTAQLADADTLNARLILSDANLTHQARPLLQGAELTFDLDSPIDPERARQDARATLSFAEARLPDIAALQAYLAPYLPSPAPLTLVSGQAQSQGSFNLTPQRLDGSASLSGSAWVTDWQSATQNHRMTSQMQLDLQVNDAQLDGSRLDIGGTRLRWLLANAAQQPSLESLLVLREGRFYQTEDAPSGRFALEGSVQQLGFLNTFLPDAHGLSLSGGGQLVAEGEFADDRLIAPSRLRVDASPLEVQFLDYQANGRGELTAQLSGPEDAQLTLSIPSFRLKGQGDSRASLEGRHLALTTTTQAVSRLMESQDPRHVTTRISLPIISVPDLSRYNSYLPDGAGIALHGGEASLNSEMVLKGLDGMGDISLRAFGAELTLLDQRLKGDLTLNFKLTEGDLEQMRFSADDSFLRLENVRRLSGDGHQDAGWWAELGLEDATLVWQTPLTLEADVDLSLRDSGLLARLFLARARDNDWLGRLLSVRDIQGRTHLSLARQQLALSGLTLSGGPLTLLAELTLADSTANGALYAQLGQLGLGIELIDREPTLKVLQPQRWFEQWRQTHQAAQSLSR